MAAPLEGIRIVDLTRILAGPFATMILADLGADVIKVERPGRGDETRYWGPPFVDGVATYFLAVNRNKRSLTLDVASQRGCEILWDLLATADVVVSNFRAGVMDRLGFSWQEVEARCPRIVYARLNGYGEQGPAAARPAFDLLIQAESGLMDLTGQPDGPPTKVGISVADEAAGLYLVQGILAALLRRARTGAGELVEVALHDAMLSMHTYQAQGYLAAGVEPRRMGSSHPSLVPYRPFATADGTVVVAVASERDWAAFCEAAELHDLVDDPSFATNAVRVRNRHALESVIGERMASRDTRYWLRALASAGVVCGRVRTLPEALDGPEASARRMIVTVPGSDLRMLGLPIAMDGAPVLRLPPPALGAHTVSLLEELGYDAADLGRLRAQGVV